MMFYKIGYGLYCICCFQIVPTALLAAILKCSISEADRLLHQQPVLRQAIHETLAKQQKASA
jgi:hypothetical protein